MSLVAWLVKQVLSYHDWVPWRRAQRGMVLLLALAAIITPTPFRAGVLAYAHDEGAIFSRLMINIERQVLCETPADRAACVQLTHEDHSGARG
jgi:hypothetical protein